MIFVTGDIHGDPETRMSRRAFPEAKEMTKDDYVIILGDFGCIWDYKGESNTEKYKLDWMEKLPFTVLFIDGNHENFDRLYSYPSKAWHGGRVHEIRPHVLHLMRGYVFNIDGKKIFTFGGASSHDIQDGILDPVKDKAKIKEWSRNYFKMFRVNRVSWWEQELPTKAEMERGERNLNKAGNKVDFILTHSPSASVIAMLGHGAYKQDILSKYLEEIRIKTDYKRWFCGHMHTEAMFNGTDIILYEQILRIS